MLKAGFARLDVTPPLGSDLSGYFHRRAAKGVRDPLYLNAVAIGDGEQTLILMAIDYIGIKLHYNVKIRQQISKRTGVPEDHILIAALHQHTAPCIANPENKMTALRDEPFVNVLYRKFADAAVMAIEDMKEATLRTAAMRELAPEKFLVCAVCANGYEGYFPTEEAFGQGGYEAKSSLFTPTLEREVVDAAKSIFHRHK